MYRKWKKAAALGLAVLIGIMMPMSTMLAAEDNTEVAQEIETDPISDADEISVDEAVSDDNESVSDEVSVEDENTVDEEVNAEDENIVDEVNADDENAGDEDDVIADDEADADDDQIVGIEVMSASDVAEAGNTEVQENTTAPVIDITLNGVSCKVDGLGGDIEYKYFNNSDVELAFSASQNGTKISFSYYLDNNPGDKAKDDIEWIDDCTSMQWKLSSNKSYVVYVKAEKDGQTVYARSCGIVTDTIAPKIVGVENGKTYPEGTKFTVEDANLDVVMVNETPAASESDGNYQVKANGTSCVIRAKDKAGNETVYSINVEGSKTPDAGNLISESGVYALKAGVKYHLAAGKWKIDGDKSVYQGDSDFYVKNDGDYKFKK